MVVAIKGNLNPIEIAATIQDLSDSIHFHGKRKRLIYYDFVPS